MHQANPHKETVHKKDRLLKKRKEKLNTVNKADTRSTSEQQQ